MRRVITLTTDFGASDYDSGVLHGVIWSIAPEARVVDLTHDIPRHDVQAAALLLERCTPFFPAGTIHVVVVDPGVGTQRRGLAARLGPQWFVGPDNGVVTPMLQHAQDAAQPVEIVHLDRPHYWLCDVSAIFHGRDIFAPVAAHLAAGAALSDVGSPLPLVTGSAPVLLRLPQPHFVAARPDQGQPHQCWRGEIMHIDAFGNLSTNLRRQHLAQGGQIVQNSDVEIHIAGSAIYGLSTTFGDGEPGQLVALFDSSGYLSICVVNGSAAARLGVQPGDKLTLQFDRPVTGAVGPGGETGVSDAG